MKSVLISIQPKWCELIASGKKTVEVRKTKPKLDTPFKCYIYCTLPPKEELFTHGCIREYARELIRLQDGRIVYDYGMRLCCDVENRPYSQDNFLCKKVIGEFVCDKVYLRNCDLHDCDTITLEELSELSCVGEDDLLKYADRGQVYCRGLTIKKRGLRPPLFMHLWKDREPPATFDTINQERVKEGGLWQTGRLLKQNTSPRRPVTVSWPRNMAFITR